MAATPYYGRYRDPSFAYAYKSEVAVSGTLYVVGIGGTTRPESSTEKALRAALREIEALGATTELFTGPQLATLPLYAPEDPARTDVARALVEAVRRADAVVIGSPGYHGGVSGLVKNAIDYLEDLREDARPYLSGRPVGVIATGAGWQGVVTTLEQLRTIVHALRGWPTPLGVGINSAAGPVFGPDDEVVDERVATQLRILAEEVVTFARERTPSSV